MNSIFGRMAAAATFGAAAVLAVAAPAQAQAVTQAHTLTLTQAGANRYAAPGDRFYVGPQSAPQGMRFANFEAAMARDPATRSSDPGWQLHRTPAVELTDANYALHTAIPDGTGVNEAAALLHKAGARCAAAANAGQIVCGYRDAETPFNGAYFDNVQWRVWLDTADGRVSHLTVTRDWTRH